MVKTGTGLVKLNGCPIHDAARGPPPEGLRAASAAGQGPGEQGGHPHPGERGRVHLAGVRDPAGRGEGRDRLLPEVHRRGLEEGDQGHPDVLRSVAGRGGPPAVRAKEVRRPLRPCPVPEVLPVREEHHHYSDLAENVRVSLLWWRRSKLL